MEEEGRRRRGRKPRDPERGAASDAERSASLRNRERQEMDDLIGCLSVALYALDRLGDAGTVGWLFQNRLHALGAVRRRVPWLARELEALSARGKAQLAWASSTWHGNAIPAGTRKGSIVWEGSTFWTQPDGKVMRNDKSTGLRINREHHCWVLVDVADVDFTPKRHYIALGGRFMALVQAAILICGKDADNLGS